MKYVGRLSLIAFAISFVSMNNAISQPNYVLDNLDYSLVPLVQYAKDMKWRRPDSNLVYGNWKNNLFSEQNEDMGEVYRVRLTNTSKVQNGKVTLSKRDPPNTKFSCITSSMSLRVEGIAWDNVVFTETADISGKWSLGGGEFPQPSCNLSASIDFPPGLDEVRVMSQVRYRFGRNRIEILKKAQVRAKGTIMLPEPDKRIVIKDLKWLDPAPGKNIMRVEFKVVREGSDDGPGDNITVAVSSNYAHCPAKNKSQFCYFYGLKKCDYYFFPTYIGCRSASKAISYNKEHGTRTQVHSFKRGQERPFRFEVPYSTFAAACKKDGKCADLRVRVRTSAEDEDIHFHWDEAFDQIFVYKEVVN